MLDSLLTKKFSASIAKWVCENWTLIEEQSLRLIRYLVASHQDNEHTYSMLMVSLITDVSEMKQFVVYTKMFLRYSKS